MTALHIWILILDQVLNRPAHDPEDIPIVSAIDAIRNNSKGKGIQDVVIQPPGLVKVRPMKEIWTRRQISKARFISFSPVFSLDSLQADHGPAAPGAYVLNETDSVVFLWLFYQDAAKIRLKNVIYGCK